MKWVDIGTVETDFGKRWVVMHACPVCWAVVCGDDIEDHEAWHKQQRSELLTRTDPRLYG
jgi:hypothetical protein